MNQFEARTNVLSQRYDYRVRYESDTQFHTLNYKDGHCFFIHLVDVDWYLLVRPTSYDLFVSPPHTYANVPIPERICVKTISNLHTGLHITVPYKAHRTLLQQRLCKSERTGEQLNHSQLYHRRLMLLNIIWRFNFGNRDFNERIGRQKQVFERKFKK